MAIATRAGDLRHSKWGSFRNEPQEVLLETLRHEMETRPKSFYEVDEMVFTPKLGFRKITDKYYRAGSGWTYTFYTRDGLYKYQEKQLLPLGDALLMQDIRMRTAARG